MAKLRLIVYRYGAIFVHGPLAGTLLALTLHSGLASGCC